jgi:hypothetical protein
VNEDLSSKEYTIECMKKGIELSDSIYKRKLDIRSSKQLKLMKENFRLQKIISKKDNEIADFSAKRLNGNIPPLSMNDSSQKISGWVNDNLRPLVYELGLENKIMEFDKSFAREHILETLQELLPRDEMVSKNQKVTLPNQSVYSLPAYSENFISRKGIAKHSGGTKVVLLF